MPATASLDWDWRARSLALSDGPWEEFPGNSILVDLPGTIGLGHADLVADNAGVTFLFTSLDGVSRSRLRLVWRCSYRMMA